MHSSNTDKALTLEQICHSMPKVELHAHLNGSVTDNMLVQMKSIADAKISSLSSISDLMSSPDNDKLISTTSNETGKAEPPSRCLETLKHLSSRSLAECWKAFGKIHEAIRTPESLYWVTCRVIEDFAQDQVIYLELRTTPKQIHDIRSKDIYIETVVKAIMDSRTILPQISVKLLISIDRKNGENDARENVLLVRKWSKMYPNIIVGLDVSGDPNFGSFQWIVPVLEEARRHGIFISCHLSEVVNIEETKKFLQFRPERVGHGQFLHPTRGGTEELWQLAKHEKIPVEVCIASNVVSGISPSIKDHYVKFLYLQDMPYIICTDDSGVFKTSVSEEYRRLLQIVPMSAQQLRKLCMEAISYIFASENEKAKIKLQTSKWWDENVSL